MSLSSNASARSKLADEFIWKDGVCNLDLVQDVINSQIEPHIAFTSGGFLESTTGEIFRSPDCIEHSSSASIKVVDTGNIPMEGQMSVPFEVHDSSFGTMEDAAGNIDTYIPSQHISAENKSFVSFLENKNTSDIADDASEDENYHSMGEDAYSSGEENNQEAPVEETMDAVDSIVLELISHVWNGVEPQNYHANIFLEWHPKEFAVQIDSGSSLLWLQAKLADDEKHPLGQEVFDPMVSKNCLSNEYVPGRYTYVYGSGNVHCYLYQEDFLLGGCKAKQQVFGAASIRQNGYFVDRKIAGVLGLGFPSKHAPIHDNLVVTLHKQGRIKFRSFSMVGPRNDPKLAAEIDRRRIMQPRGQIIFGAVCRCYYTGEIGWSSILNDQPRQWMINLEEVKVNDRLILTNQRALIDTGTAYIVTSEPNFTKMRKCLRGWTVTNKESLFQYPKKELISISFKFAGRHFQLQPQDFSLGEVQIGEEKTAEKMMCSSITKTAHEWRLGDDAWILGGIFLDNLVTIFDFENDRIGFATIVESERGQGPNQGCAQHNASL